jgi:hypothetical protein
MLQLLYISSSKLGQPPIDLDALLQQCQTNNRRDGVTGLLYTDGRRFLQVLEGAKDTIDDTFLRILADPRHHALVLLSRRLIAQREFGEWAMARRAFGVGHDEFMTRIGDLCRDADPNIRGTFEGLIEARRVSNA